MSDLLLKRSAEFAGDDRTIRYALSRWWGDGPRLLVIGMNPSVADEVRDDATITRCMRRARDMGLDGLEMRNVFPFVATKPADLWARMLAMPDMELLGHIRANSMAVTHATIQAGAVLVAWGTLPKEARPSAARMVDVLTSLGRPLLCLGTTRDGSPRHPSRLGYAVQPQPWSAPS